MCGILIKMCLSSLLLSLVYFRFYVLFERFLILLDFSVLMTWWQFFNKVTVFLFSIFFSFPLI